MLLNNVMILYSWHVLMVLGDFYMSVTEGPQLPGYLNELWRRHPFADISAVGDHALREEELQEQQVH